jgi:hypothetical protein
MFQLRSTRQHATLPFNRSPMSRPDYPHSSGDMQLSKKRGTKRISTEDRTLIVGKGQNAGETAMQRRHFLLGSVSMAALSASFFPNVVYGQSFLDPSPREVLKFPGGFLDPRPSPSDGRLPDEGDDGEGEKTWVGWTLGTLLAAYSALADLILFLSALLGGVGLASAMETGGGGLILVAIAVLMAIVALLMKVISDAISRLINDPPRPQYKVSAECAVALPNELLTGDRAFDAFALTTLESANAVLRSLASLELWQGAAAARDEAWMAFHRSAFIHNWERMRETLMAFAGHAETAAARGTNIAANAIAEVGGPARANELFRGLPDRVANQAAESWQAMLSLNAGKCTDIDVFAAVDVKAILSSSPGLNDVIDKPIDFTIMRERAAALPRFV